MSDKKGNEKWSSDDLDEQKPDCRDKYPSLLVTVNSVSFIDFDHIQQAEVFNLVDVCPCRVRDLALFDLDAHADLNVSSCFHGLANVIGIWIALEIV